MASSKRALEDDSHVTLIKKQKISKSPTRVFQHQWKAEKSWLRYDSDNKSMFCDICIKAKNQNSFVHGCKIMKKDAVTKHSKCKGDYIFL